MSLQGRIIWIFSVALLCHGLWTSVGCSKSTTYDRTLVEISSLKQGSASASSTSSRKDAKESASRSPSTQPIKDVPGLGHMCAFDGACPGYLRCIDKRCVLPAAMVGAHTESTPRVRFREQSDPESRIIGSFYLELAITPFQQTRGLMHRETMHEEWGMLFVYPRDMDLSFWMKDTHLALDMVFIDSSGKVVWIIENAEPHSLEPRRTPHPARYVLEVNAGLTRQHGIEVGQYMFLDNVARPHLPQPKIIE